MATAIKQGYQALSQSNEYFYRLGDKELLALIVQVTGVESDNRAAALTLATVKNLKGLADFDALEASLTSHYEPTPAAVEEEMQPPLQLRGQVPKADIGLNLSYTINLNLPATSDQAVFNAIFRSLKEHLLASHG